MQTHLLDKLGGGAVRGCPRRGDAPLKQLPLRLDAWGRHPPRAQVRQPGECRAQRVTRCTHPHAAAVAPAASRPGLGMRGHPPMPERSVSRASGPRAEGVTHLLQYCSDSLNGAGAKPAGVKSHASPALVAL